MCTSSYDCMDVCAGQLDLHYVSCQSVVNAARNAKTHLSSSLL